jgi:transketolase N-terminal domain/subunit
MDTFHLFGTVYWQGLDTFPVAELGTFRKLSSRLQGHPSTDKKLPGIRMASGSLGQGLSVAAGAAQVKKLTGDKGIVYTLHGDGGITGRSDLGSCYVCGSEQC